MLVPGCRRPARPPTRSGTAIGATSIGGELARPGNLGTRSDDERAGQEPGELREDEDPRDCGAAPKAVDEPLKILLTVDNWVWVSRPITTS